MSKKKYIDKCWYCYNGVGDPFQASSYRKISYKPGGQVGTNINAIYATGDYTPISPLSTNIQLYVSLALVTGMSQPPHIDKKSKYFVFMRS